MWLWMFWPMISGQTVCGFRDSAYLYYPLFKWIDSVWASGEIPLWNPYCNYGLPVVGDGSSSVFYPGKLIFLCRFLSFPSRYGIYLSIHILIAAAGAYRFARVMKANQAGATLAAISYAFSGSVLFQVTNVIYLVSAAWLPFALMLVWNGVIRNEWRSAILAGVVCALMILGGDPQMVYHVGLIAAASVFFKFWKIRRTLLRTQKVSSNASYSWLLSAGLRLALMVVVTSGLAAIQILPTAHWAERSERASSGVIANVYHVWSYALEISGPTLRPEKIAWSRNGAAITYLDKTITHSLLSSPRRGSQKDATYQFSQPPWSIAELFFPNVMGKPFPTHQRWSDALPGAERIWTPSIYAGFLTVLLALGQFRFWGKRKRHVWLSRVALFFTVASFGWFGLVWLLNEGLAVAGLAEFEIDGMKIGPQVGGLYWLMVTVLPKYFMFRYPAKLFVIASLMISVLAGLGLTKTKSTCKRANLAGDWNPLGRVLSLYSGLVVIVFCLVGLILLWVAPLDLWLGRVRPNPLFGPLAVEKTVAALKISLAHPLIVIGTMVALLGMTNRIKHGSISILAASIVLVTAFEVSVANRWLLADVDANKFESPLEIEDDLQKLIAGCETAGAIPAIYRNINVESDPSWQNRASEKRLDEIVCWQRETLFPKHHLGKGIALLGSFSSVWPREYTNLAHRSAAPSKQLRFHSWRSQPGYGYDARIRLNKADGFGVNQVETRRRILAHLLMGNMQPRSVDRRYGQALSPHDSLETIPVADDSSIEFLNRDCRQFSLKVVAGEDLTLVLEQLFDDGWVVRLQNLQNGNILIPKPESFINLWVKLPLSRGEYDVTLTYSPREFWIGLGVSVGSLLLLAIYTLCPHSKRLYPAAFVSAGGGAPGSRGA